MAHVLLLEDDRDLRTSLREILEEAGHVVTEAEDGADGLRRHYQTPADIVITDIRMPIMTGHEAIVELRRDFPDLKIVAVSGGAAVDSEVYGQVALKLGADRALSKPFKPVDLLNLVHELST